MRAFLAVLLLSGAIFAGTAKADTYCVAPASGCDHTATTIQNGLNQAHAHAGDDTVQLGAATYNIDLDADPGRSLTYPAAGAQGRATLRGAGPTRTTITKSLAVFSTEAMIGGEENILQRGQLDVRDLGIKLPASQGAGIQTNGTTFDNLDIEIPAEATAIRLTPSGAALTSSTIEGSDSTSNPSICVGTSPTSASPSYTLTDVTANGCTAQMFSSGNVTIRRLRMDGKLGVDFGSTSAALIDNSVIRMTGPGAAVTSSISGPASTAIIVNQSTLVGAGLGSGIHAFNNVSASATATVRAFDSIVRGFQHSLVADGSISGGAKILGNYDSYATGTTSAASGDTISFTSSVNDPDPLFSGPSDFSLQPGSPLVDFDPTPFEPGGDSPFDLAGNVRIIGGKRDLGAYELPALPTAVTEDATAVTQTGASIAGSANSGGAADGGSATLLYGDSDAYGSSLPLPALPRSLEAQPIAATLAGLTAGTTYHYALQVTNSRGTTTSPDRTFTTTAADSPPTSGGGSGETGKADGAGKGGGKPDGGRPSGGPAAPTLTKATLAPRALHPLAKGPTIATGGQGSKLTLALTAPARVTFTVLRRGKSTRVGRPVGRKLAAGTTKLRFSGRVAGRPLAPGKYVLQLTPAGGKARTINFQILG
jgi:hypothetical protein